MKSNHKFITVRVIVIVIIIIYDDKGLYFRDDFS